MVISNSYVSLPEGRSLPKDGVIVLNLINTSWWLTYLPEKYAHQIGSSFQLLGKITNKLKNVPNHQPVYIRIYIIVYSWWWFMVFLAKLNEFKKNRSRWSRTKWCGDYIFEVMMFRCLQRILQISRMNLYLSIHPPVLYSNVYLSVYPFIHLDHPIHIYIYIYFIL